MGLHPLARFGLGMAAPVGVAALIAWQPARGPELLEPFPVPDADHWVLPSRFTPEARDKRRQVFTRAKNDGAFRRLGEPGDDDWLALVPERGQTVADYLDARINRKSEQRGALDLQPLEALPDGPRQLLMPALREHLSIYFGLEVRELPAGAIDPHEHDAEALAKRLAAHVPKDSLGLLGILDRDLDAPGRNFVFGFGLYRDRAGVISIERLTDEPQRLLRRSLKLSVHEVGHLLSLEHCIFYECAMGGANTLEEIDRHPLHLCPVCQAKIAHNVGFDPIERYRKLADFYRRFGLAEEAKFASARQAAAER